MIVLVALLVRAYINSGHSVLVIWQNCLHVEEIASSDLAKLPVPVIWQNCLSVDSVPVIWQNCLCQRFGRIACDSDLAELPIC